MFLHSLKYNLLINMRVKVMLFWQLVFPIILGTMFFFAFSSITEKTETFNAIETAAVIENNETLKTTLDSLSTGDDSLLSIHYCSKEEAEKLITDGTVEGIIYFDDDIHLTVASADSISASILTTFLESYKATESTLNKIVAENPQNIQAAIDAMSVDVQVNIEQDFGFANSDNVIQYFYNLFAMNSLFGIIFGLYCAINNQANLSKTGMRKNISPTRKSVEISSSLVITILILFVAQCISSVYFVYILKLNFGIEFGYMILINLVGAITGISMGFFLGSIGGMKESTKVSIATTVSLLLSGLSGLMSEQVKLIVDKIFPLFNQINPAALIFNCFYSVNIYGTYDRMWQSLGSLMIISALFCFGGFLLTRRKRYASI